MPVRHCQQPGSSPRAFEYSLQLICTQDTWACLCVVVLHAINAMRWHRRYVDSFGYVAICTSIAVNAVQPLIWAHRVSWYANWRPYIQALRRALVSVVLSVTFRTISAHTNSLEGKLLGQMTTLLFATGILSQIMSTIFYRENILATICNLIFCAVLLLPSANLVCNNLAQGRNQAAFQFIQHITLGLDTASALVLQYPPLYFSSKEVTWKAQGTQACKAVVHTGQIWIGVWLLALAVLLLEEQSKWRYIHCFDRRLLQVADLPAYYKQESWMFFVLGQVRRYHYLVWASLPVTWLAACAYHKVV